MDSSPSHHVTNVANSFFDDLDLAEMEEVFGVVSKRDQLVAMCKATCPEVLLCIGSTTTNDDMSINGAYILTGPGDMKKAITFVFCNDTPQHFIVVNFGHKVGLKKYGRHEESQFHADITKYVADFLEDYNECHPPKPPRRGRFL